MNKEKTIELLQDQVKISLTEFEGSRREGERAENYYHNRQFSDTQLAILKERGQPAETHNIIKMYTRFLTGYLSTVVNTVVIKPRKEESYATAYLLHDISQHVFEDNKFKSEGENIKLDLLLHGLACIYEEVIETGEFDEYERPIRRIKLHHVPARELLIDPRSTKADYSDAEYIHRFKWLSKQALVNLFKHNIKSDKKIEAIIENLSPYNNHISDEGSDFLKTFTSYFNGVNNSYDSYLVIHSVYKDKDNKTWSVYWIEDVLITKEEVTYLKVAFPYRVQKLIQSNKTEYYGLFRECLESQMAINQALIKIQLEANTTDVYIEENSVEDVDTFKEQINTMGEVKVVKKLGGIQVVNKSTDIAQQLRIIQDKEERIMKILGINRSFLGESFSHDSGVKVKRLQGTTKTALSHLVTKVEQMYLNLGKDIVNLIQQYYTAKEALRITNKATGDRWLALNQPMLTYQGRVSPEGEPVLEENFDYVLNPSDNKPLLTPDGNYIVAPIPTKESEISFAPVDLEIDTSAYDDEDEANRQMFEHILPGPAGQALMQVNPQGYFKAYQAMIQNMGTRKSKELAEIFKQTADQLSPEQAQQMQEQADPSKQVTAQAKDRG